MAERVPGVYLGGQSTTRRAFLRGAGALGAAGAALAVLGPRRVEAAPSGLVRGVLSGRIAASAATLGAGELDGLALAGGGPDAALVAVASGAVYRSPVLPLEFSATHFGLRWAAEGPGSADLAFAVRTSLDGRDWTPWASVAAAGGCEGHGEDRYSPLLNDLIAHGRTIPVARVAAMHEGKRRARARRADE